MLLNTDGLTDSVVVVATRKVCESRPLRMTSTPATLPPAPPRLSTTTGWPSASTRGAWMVRTSTSTRPPGASPTTRRTGLVGQAPAWAQAAGVEAVMASAARVASVRRLFGVKGECMEVSGSL